jgi:DNA primase
VALLPVVRIPTFITRGRAAYVAQLKQSKPYLEFLLDRAASGQDLTRDEPRREFLKKMLTVAARIPDPAARDQFADRLAHKARVTEDVVRAEIRRAAAARKTEVSPERLRSLTAPLRDVEKGLLWALMHTPEEALKVLRQLEVIDLEGLRAQDILVKALELPNSPDLELPGGLMERLTDQEQQLLTSVAAGRESGLLDLDTCVQSLRFARIERELAGIQREIDAVSGQPGSDLNPLLRRKNELRTELDRARRGPRDGYNK